MATVMRMSIVQSVVATIAIGLVLYILSYAPVVRWKIHQRPKTESHDPHFNSFEVPIDSGILQVYRPVDWLLDNTALKEPLNWWAGLFGVNGEFRRASGLRETFGDIPPPQSIYD